MSYHSVFTGLLLIATGAFSSGSFAIPFGKIKGWKWESYWLVYSFGAYIIFPLIACLIFAPGFLDIYSEVPSDRLLKVFLLGAVYGIGNLSFGLSLRYLGISLGYALSLGLMLAIGTLVTTIIWCIYLGLRNRSLEDYSKSTSAKTLSLNYLFALSAGFLWFIQFILYGMGKSKMGPYTFTSWGILMGLTIVFATVWGLYRKEWKGAPLKVYILMIISLMIIISSSYIIGISGSI